MSDKIWVNSGDAHVLEPDDLWHQRMPADLAVRMPRSEKIDDRTEVLHVDGRSFRRQIGRNPVMTAEDLEAAGTLVADSPHRQAGMTFTEMGGFGRPPGAWDVQLRLKDLDNEGIWGEIVYPSIGLWNGLIKDPGLYREGVRVLNDWLKETFIDVTTRSIPAAEISTRSVEDAVAETIRVADMGFKAISLPATLDDDGIDNWNHDMWEPLWATVEETGMVLGVHVGSDATDPSDGPGVVYRGPGGAVLNWVETAFGGQRAATMLVACGALDRHPGLKLLISEGGATWVPFLADRMDEAYRQHGVFVRPKLSRPPSEIIYEQVYASFQHDRSAVQAYVAMGYENVMWGSDYPHLEGTFGHTQKTLHELFDDVTPEVRRRITRGSFEELFPHVSTPPEARAESAVA
jgi:predicted TIM-barrel fold metal-dependent hydrolase